MTEFIWQFGERFRTIRKMAKLNQDEFGGLLGVSRQTINAYENNRQRPPLDMMEKVCAQEHISPIWLLSGYGSPKLTDNYTQAEGVYTPQGIADDLLSPEQKALINFVTYNRELADKLSHLLMGKGLSGLSPDAKLDL